MDIVTGDKKTFYCNRTRLSKELSRINQPFLLLEIAPARDLSEDIRARLFADAIAICKHIRYQGVGNVNFLVDFEGNHYFIGMSARLQMEHSVTEEVTG
ncbi:hypothetical protein ANCDUO_17138 [Ancylostoma duodenale]|uniref:Carbamoyl phosphate synthase ATP-binding domain-containing protein n=1 Tax=Ancylostoma duodenale TaxID=51022 RepID=A0A0C2FW10_9BILA|nr:hypothetical protein ANCDUO_17138 [Ancylostoma duodenale]